MDTTDRTTVWLAIAGALLVLGGIALACIGLVHAPAATHAEPHPSVWNTAAALGLLAFGLLCILDAIYVIAAFFFRLPLPQTRLDPDSERPPQRTPGPAIQVEDSSRVSFERGRITTPGVGIQAKNSQVDLKDVHILNLPTADESASLEEIRAGREWPS
jgi:hypothetical protein